MKKIVLVFMSFVSFLSGIFAQTENIDVKREMTEKKIRQTKNSCGLFFSSWQYKNDWRLDCKRFECRYF